MGQNDLWLELAEVVVVVVDDHVEHPVDWGRAWSNAQMIDCQIKLERVSERAAADQRQHDRRAVKVDRS